MAVKFSDPVSGQILWFGAANPGGQDASIAKTSEAAQATSIANRAMSNTACIYIPQNYDMTVSGIANLASVSAEDNQFTLDWTNAATEATSVNCLAIGGQNVEAIIQQIAAPAAPGPVSYTGVGFEPQQLIIFGLEGTLTPSTAAGGGMSISIMDATDAKAVSTASQNGVVGGSNTSRIFAKGAVEMLDPTAQIMQATLVSLDADGYTLDWIATKNANVVTVICLRGMQSKLITGVEPATDSQVSLPVGFAPKAGVLLTAMSEGEGFSYDVPDGMTGQSLNFDGVNDKVDCGNDASLNWGTGNGSLALWMKYVGPNEAHTRHVAGNRDSAGYRIAIYQSQIYAQLENGVTVNLNSGFSISEPAWHHVAMVRDGNTIRTYVDGTAWNTADGSDLGNIDTTDPFVMSLDFTNSRWFQGLIDDCRVYTQALSPDEITYLYTNGASGTDPGIANLTGHWTLDGDLLDSSGNGNDGTPSGFADDFVQPDARIGIGAWDSRNSQAFSGAVDEDNVTPTNSDRVQDADNACVHLDNAKNVVGEMHAMGAGTDIIEDWNKTDGTAREHTWLMFGDTAGGAPPQPDSVSFTEMVFINRFWSFMDNTEGGDLYIVRIGSGIQDQQHSFVQDIAGDWYGFVDSEAMNPGDGIQVKRDGIFYNVNLPE